MKVKSLALLFFGIFNVVSVVPCLFFAFVFAWSVMLSNNMIWSDLTNLAAIAILSLSPISCIVGIVQGIRHWKLICARICVILSIIGFLLFAVVMGFMLHVSV